MFRRLTRILRWPERDDNYLNPWFVIAWRVLLTPLYYSGLALAWVSILLGHGYHHARQFWLDNY